MPAAKTTKATKARKRTPMSAQHKAALARGRDEGRAIRRYLDALETQRPRRGRRRTPDSIKRRLATINERVKSADSLSRLHLLQERVNLETELERSSTTVDLSGLEKAFVKVAKDYGDRKGIGYDAWRSAGVSVAVLQKAGITRAKS